MRRKPRFSHRLYNHCYFVIDVFLGAQQAMLWSAAMDSGLWFRWSLACLGGICALLLVGPFCTWAMARCSAGRSAIGLSSRGFSASSSASHSFTHSVRFCKRSNCSTPAPSPHQGSNTRLSSFLFSGSNKIIFYKAVENAKKWKKLL
jgi:hypothetical protein